MGRVADALRAVDRRDFLPPDQQAYAALDAPLPIGYDATNSQPTTVRVMLELLDPQPGDRVLDVGTGSGWTTALLAHLVAPTGSVVGVERVPELVAVARTRIGIVPDEKHHRSSESGAFRQGLSPLDLHTAEPGVLGWPERAPYDRILVSAEASRLPSALIDQLAPGGALVIPVDGVMLRVILTDDGPEVGRHGHFRFVPLVED